jgi:hypothetical protein
MKPDAYIPFYLSDFLQAVEGHRDSVAMGYLRAIWHYWKHTHCTGLDNDAEYLQRLIRCDSAEWARTGPIIFGSFFTLGADKKWHQKRTLEIWTQAEQLYQTMVERSKTANAARWGKTPDKEPEKAPEKDPPTQGVLVGVLVGDLQGSQSKSKSKSDLKSKSESSVSAKESRPADTCDQIWLAILAQDKTYEGINVVTEHGKMLRWCEVHRKKANRKRFVNWLNKAVDDLPMKATKALSNKAPSTIKNTSSW